MEQSMNRNNFAAGKKEDESKKAELEASKSKLTRQKMVGPGHAIAGQTLISDSFIKKMDDYILKKRTKMKTILAGLITILLLTACSCSYTAYKLSSGKVVECREWTMLHCGIKLFDCKDGATYFCQTNIEELPTPNTSRTAR
jgi:hypothetical protein